VLVRAPDGGVLAGFLREAPLGLCALGLLAA
jgi:hypothetical protein